ncbi:histidine phosphatase family protein [Eubacterium xylanophilum]|uniref:histidine phosphatase family protein n=1 Tax=Eubacterium xylanophilum TaxID=39497 RepID=UPI00047A9FA4|nr:histidine phosphatase family protein [Eubacterium xylanophilum]
MKIGLVRHFKVDCPHKVMMTSREFREWSEKYEHARILKKKVNMGGIKWDVCYCSDLERAIKTAEEVYTGNIYVDALLREVDNAPFIQSEKIKLPFPIWHFCGRLAWFFKSKSQPENIVETRRRVRRFFKHIDWKQDNVLIVSHGFLIFNFIYELFRLGFWGQEVRRVKNGVLYVYEIPDYKRPFQFKAEEK